MRILVRAVKGAELVPGSESVQQVNPIGPTPFRDRRKRCTWRIYDYEHGLVSTVYATVVAEREPPPGLTGRLYEVAIERVRATRMTMKQRRARREELKRGR